MSVLLSCFCFVAVLVVIGECFARKGSHTSARFKTTSTMVRVRVANLYAHTLLYKSKGTEAGTSNLRVGNSAGSEL